MTNLMQILADEGTLLSAEALQAVKGGEGSPPSSCWMDDE